MRTALRLFACILAAGALPSAARSESFAFWPKDGAKAAAGFQSMEGHPCGEVANANVSKLPIAANGPLLSEDVVELNAVGKVIRRWPMPVDYVPRALRRHELLIVLGDTKFFWVRSDGSFRRASMVSAPDQKIVKCDLKSVFGTSDYAQCSVFVDLASHKERTLGYQTVCS